MSFILECLTLIPGLYCSLIILTRISFFVQEPIVASYVCGFTNKLNITETDLKIDERLKTLFSTSVHELTTKQRELDKAGLIKKAKDVGKPIQLMVLLVRQPISNKTIKIGYRTVHFSFIFRAFFRLTRFTAQKQNGKN